MVDLIDRQVAIDVAKDWYESMICSTFEKLERKLKAVPPAQTQRMKGKWIKNSNGTYSCDKCHSWIPNEQHYYANFCLYCGADMREKEYENISEGTL